MKKLRVVSKVFDKTAQEWVARTIEVPIGDDTALSLQRDMRENTPNMRTYGHGDGTIKSLVFKTPLRNEKRFAFVGDILIIDEEDNAIGGSTYL